jgi:hypothetical protein
MALCCTPIQPMCSSLKSISVHLVAGHNKTYLGMSLNGWLLEPLCPQSGVTSLASSTVLHVDFHGS